MYFWKQNLSTWETSLMREPRLGDRTWDRTPSKDEF